MAEIRLYEEGGASITRKSDDPNIAEDGVYTWAQVVKGQWVLYTNTDYNPKTQGSSQVIVEGEGKAPLSFVPKSLRSVKTFNQEGVTLSEHIYYGGQEQSCYSDTSTVLGGQSSSMIVSGAVWKLYRKPNYDGSQVTRGPGQYPTPNAMGVPNDTLKSIQKV